MIIPMASGVPLIIPTGGGSSNSQPSSYTYCFETDNGVNGEVTFNTSDKEKAGQLVQTMLDSTKWKSRVVKFKPTHFLTILGLSVLFTIVAGMATMLFLLLLNAADILHYRQVNECLVWLVRIGLVIWTVPTIGFYIDELFERKLNK